MIFKFGPIQPKLAKFPQTSSGKQSRSFQIKWYSLYGWVEYSISKDSIFCFYCRVFNKEHIVDGSDGFTPPANGFRNWKKVVGKNCRLKKHSLPDFHRFSYSAWKDCGNKRRRNIPQEIATNTIKDFYRVNIWFPGRNKCVHIFYK